jgi:hypothetical protein
MIQPSERAPKESKLFVVPLVALSERFFDG